MIIITNEILDLMQEFPNKVVKCVPLSSEEVSTLFGTEDALIAQKRYPSQFLKECVEIYTGTLPSPQYIGIWEIPNYLGNSQIVCPIWTNNQLDIKDDENAVAWYAVNIA